MKLLNFIKKVGDWIKEKKEEAEEEAKYNTEFYLFELKEISKLADEYNINILSKCDMGWEDYDKKLLQIRNLDLSNKGLTTIPYCLFSLIEKNEPYLISLKGNKIEDIPSDFNELCKYTKELDFSHNRISSIGKNFFEDSKGADKTRVVKMNLSFNKIKELPFNLQFDYRLKSLNLSYNKLKGFDLCWRENSLEYLDLSHNQLENFILDTFEYLKVLKINNNNIQNKLSFDLKKVFLNKESSLKNNPISDNQSPFEEEIKFSISSKSYAYINNCFSCGAGIDSRVNIKCSDCKLYICNRCGACFCK